MSRAVLLRVARVLAVVLFGVLVIVVRVVVSSRAELGEAEARLAANDPESAADAIDRFGRAARLDAPGNPYSSRALSRLEALASESEARGDKARALVAWREVRSAILATRSAIRRHEALRRRADERIAVLAAALESPSVDPAADEGARARWHAARLGADDSPSVGWSLAAIAGMALWIGCALGLLTRGFDERLRPRRGPVLAWAAGVALGFALFLVALVRA